MDMAKKQRCALNFAYVLPSLNILVLNLSDLIGTWTLLTEFLITYILYRYARGDYIQQENIMESNFENCDDDTQGEGCQAKPFGVPLTRSSFIDAAYTNETILPKVHRPSPLGSL